MKDTKICKGTLSAKGYGCGLDVPAKSRKKGLCQHCYRGFIFSGTNEGNQEKDKFFLSNKKTVIKETKVKTKKQKLDSKSIRALIIDAKAPFQKLIRIRDHRKTCICCDELLPYTLGDYDAGHLFKSEIYTGVIFHPYNVNGQRVYCNKELNGNEGKYTNGLIKRHGWARYIKLHELAIRSRTHRWDRQELINMKAYYLNELREVEKGKDINDVDFSIGIINYNKLNI